MNFMMACKKFFGMKEGQSLSQFTAEVRELSEKDKKELAELLTQKLHETGELPVNEEVKV